LNSDHYNFFLNLLLHFRLSDRYRMICWYHYGYRPWNDFRHYGCHRMPFRRHGYRHRPWNDRHRRQIFP
jgi:hypothetical protein